MSLSLSSSRWMCSAPVASSRSWYSVRRVSPGTNTFHLLISPTSLAMATTRTSMVLLTPRVVWALMVMASPTFTCSFSSCFSNTSTVLGWLRSSMLPEVMVSTFLNAGSFLMSMPLMPACIDPWSDDHLGPAAAAGHGVAHLGHRLADGLQHLLVFGDHRRRLPGGHLEEAAHVQVAGRQRGGGVSMVLRHPGRQAVQQHQHGGDAGQGQAQEQGAPPVLQQVAEGDADVFIRTWFDLLPCATIPLYSSDCIAWRGVTRMASQAGYKLLSTLTISTMTRATTRLVAPRVGCSAGPREEERRRCR